MNHKTRYFMLAAAGIVVAGLCTGLIAYYGGLPTGAVSQAAGRADLDYVPADASLVAFADVREVMASDLRRRLQELEPHGERGRQQFESHTGINLESDVDSIVMAMLPEAGKGEAFVIVRGRFNEVRIESLARERGAAPETYEGVRLFTKTGSGEAGTLAFLGSGLMAVGQDSAVRRAIDARKSGRGIATNAEIMKLIGEIESGTNAWAVGRFDAIANRASLPDSVASQIPAIQWFSAGGRVNGGVSGLFRAEARDDQAATNLRDVLRGFLALAKMQAGSRPEMQTMLQSLELGGTGKTVDLSFSVPAQVFETLAPQLRQRAQ
jgi:hypothetical protein